METNDHSKLAKYIGTVVFLAILLAFTISWLVSGEMPFSNADIRDLIMAVATAGYAVAVFLGAVMPIAAVGDQTSSTFKSCMSIANASLVLCGFFFLLATIIDVMEKDASLISKVHEVFNMQTALVMFILLVSYATDFMVTFASRSGEPDIFNGPEILKVVLASMMVCGSTFNEHFNTDFQFPLMSFYLMIAIALIWGAVNELDDVSITGKNFASAVLPMACISFLAVVYL